LPIEEWNGRHAYNVAVLVTCQQIDRVNKQNNLNNQRKRMFTPSPPC